MLVVCACGLLAASAKPGDALLVHAANGSLASFSAGVGADNATFSTVGGGYGLDKEGFAAQYPGTAGTGSADGSLSVSWAPGQTVAYGAAFRLPQNFHSATAGQQLMLGWSSAPGADGSTQQGGVVIDYSDNLGYLVTNTDAGAMVTQQVLAGPFALPTGRWFALQVRQLLSAAAPAQSGVYINGQLVAWSTAADFTEQQVNEVSFGIVQLSGGAEDGSVALKLDRTFAAVYTGYLNPLKGDRYISGRTDQGVDFCLKRGEPIHAIGDGVVVGIDHDWFEGQPYVWYQLVDGPYAGRFIYVAEQIRKLAQVGASLSAGQTVARYNRHGSCIETGWSVANGATMARVTSGYYEGQVTPAGVSFAHFLIQLGVHGRFELRATHTTRLPAVSWDWTQDPWTQGP